MIQHIPPVQTWQALLNDPDAQLVDVRTDAEWNFVGLTDLVEAGKQPLLISWQIYPAMQINETFAQDLADAGLLADHHIYFLCRSGARSLSAATCAAAAGFLHVYNIAGGFEGDPDAKGHRGKLNGWKAASLPWRQR